MTNQEPPKISRRDLFRNIGDKFKNTTKSPDNDLPKDSVGGISQITRRDFLKLSSIPDLKIGGKKTSNKK